MFKRIFVLALMFTASSMLVTADEEAKKPSTCVDTIATCPAGQCLAKSDCNMKGKTFTWDESKCDGDKCGCCEEQPVCYKKDKKCKAVGGTCVKSADICSSEPGYTFNSTLCTNTPVVNGTDCGCCYPTEPEPQCLEKDDTCKSMGAGAKCVKDMFECARGNSGFVFDSTKCKTGANDTTCGCCYKPKQCKMSGECGKKKGKCMSDAQCNLTTHSFDNSCGADAACGCCFPKA